MKKNLTYCALLFLASTLLCTCKDKYVPSVIQSNLNYLVVDGLLINGADSTIIRLSRTSLLDENVAKAGEENAQMTVEDAEGNTLYNFVQLNKKGQYAVPGMNLDITKKYRLRINTTDGNQYVSDDVTIKDTPPIDSISWQQKPDGVTIYANTHDPLATTTWYRWDYTETWDLFTTFFSVVKYDPTGITFYDQFPPRKQDEYIYHCWKTFNSNQILAASTANLSADRVNLFPLRFIPQNAIELNNAYSILVKQYALTKEAYEYFLNIKRISEQTGSIFDAQPSELESNLHCINNPAQRVIGYLTGGSVQQQRIFIRNEQVRPWKYLPYCPDKRKIPLIEDSIKYFFGGPSPLLTPIEDVYDPFFSGVNGGLPACTDCTSTGGINVKPDYWPY